MRNLMGAKQICGARAKSTGNPCKNPPMPNGRCKFHGGMSPGRPIVSGMFTNKAKADRAKLRELIKSVKELLK